MDGPRVSEDPPRSKAFPAAQPLSQPEPVTIALSGAVSLPLSQPEPVSLPLSEPEP
jgi:hypothetical protein